MQLFLLRVTQLLHEIIRNRLRCVKGKTFSRFRFCHPGRQLRHTFQLHSFHLSDTPDVHQTLHGNPIQALQAFAARQA